MNYINKKTAEQQSPLPKDSWISLDEKIKINEIKKNLDEIDTRYDFEVINAFANGHVILKTSSSIHSSERGLLLLEIEMYLKKKIDDSITIWLQPVGDKSKLRQLRGMEIK